MAISSLATEMYPAHIGNYTVGRQGNKINHITIHHMGGVLTAKQCGAIFARAGRKGSSHYGIGKDGEIASYVDEDNIAWTDSNWKSNCTSVTIENSNSKTGGDWSVSDATLSSLIKLVADVAKRNGLGKLVKGKNLTWHSMYVATDCPGPYLLSKIDYIVEQANKINEEKDEPIPTPGKPALKTNEQIADEVIAGKWGNGQERKDRLTKAGYDYGAVQAIVNQKCKKPAETGALKAGDVVRITRWVDYNGRSLLPLSGTYRIMQLNGNRAVVTRNGRIYAAIPTGNLKRA